MKHLIRIYYIFIFFLATLTISCYWGLKWYLSSYVVGFEAFLFTLLSPMKGTGGESIKEGMMACFPKIGVCVLLLGILFIFITPNKFSKKILSNISNKINQPRFFFIVRCLMFILVSTAFVLILHEAYYKMGVNKFLETRKERTLIYEKEYVSPNASGVVSASSKTHNLIHIVMESMETSYASTNVGGCLEYNCIPNLTRLALENDTFSVEGSIGGILRTAHAEWTIAALLAFHSGVPFSFPIDGNLMSERKYFASGLTSLGDVLKGYGYQQVFLCGSDADFGGRRSFFEQHGNYFVYDYGVALERGDIPEDYKVWWGFEDEYLYEIAKREATRLSETGNPFNLTFLTVDTHHKEGYVCNLCKDEYQAKTANVVSCADRQVADFIEWCKTQPFWENTTIVITGDHHRMDTALIDEYKPGIRRKMLCIFINSVVQTKEKRNRDYTSLDVFPTILSAMGFNIENSRLGLGTDLYSGRATLCEELGYDEFNLELSKPSDFYMREFP